MKGQSARNLGGAVAVMLAVGCTSGPPPELRINAGLETTSPQKVAATEPQPKPPVPARKAHSPTAESSTGAAPAAHVETAAVPAEPTASAVAAPTIAAPVAPPVAADQGIDGLVGLDENGVQAVLGAPMLQEDRAPTKLWVFRNRNCTLNITLYPDVKTRQFHALSYEVISDVHTPERTRQCVAELAAQFAKR